MCASGPSPSSQIRQPRVFLKTWHDLVGSHDSSDKDRSTSSYPFCHRKDGWDIKAGMARIGPRMTVHIIKKAERGTIHQGGFFAGRKAVHPKKAGFRRPF